MMRRADGCDDFMMELPTRPFNALYKAGYRTREQIEAAAKANRLSAYMGVKSEYLVREALQGRTVVIDKNRQIEKRDKRLYALRNVGRTHAELARMFGISKERVAQICRKMDHRERERNEAQMSRISGLEQTKDAVQVVADYYGIEPSDVCRACLHAAADKDEELKRWNEAMTAYTGSDGNGVTE